MYHLREVGVSASLNLLSNTVVFERPRDEAFVHKWQLACEGNKYHLSTPNEETILARDSAYISHGVVFIATHHSAQLSHTTRHNAHTRVRRSQESSVMNQLTWQS